ncbi:hypothetical protein [Stutzerimonas kunmingensis]
MAAALNAAVAACRSLGSASCSSWTAFQASCASVAVSAPSTAWQPR